MGNRSLGWDRWSMLVLHMPKLMGLLKAVRQVLWVKIVSLLIWLINWAIPLVTWVWQLDQILFVNVWPEFGSLTLVIWRLLQIVIDNLEACVGLHIDTTIGIIAHVLVQHGVADLLLAEWLELLLSGDEGSVAQLFHHGVLDTGAG